MTGNDTNTKGTAMNNPIQRQIVDVLILKDENGRTSFLKGRRFARLRKEILACGGGETITALVESGYVGFLCDFNDGSVDLVPLDALSPELFA
jgi:hypothetical protein